MNVSWNDWPFYCGVAMMIGAGSWLAWNIYQNYISLYIEHAIENKAINWRQMQEKRNQRRHRKNAGKLMTFKFGYKF